MYKLLKSLALIAAILVVFAFSCLPPSLPPQGDLEYPFEKKGMVMVIPNQGEEVRIITMTPFFEAELPAQVGFAANREVISFKVLGEEQETLTVFEPPLRLYVIYRDEDLQHAKGNEEKLGLGFWNGKRWIVFTREEHGFELHKKDSPLFKWPFDEFFEFPKDALGYGVASASSWEDYPVAWGRHEEVFVFVDKEEKVVKAVVVVPPQEGKKAEVRDLPLLFGDNPPAQAGFVPNREVINFEVVDKNENPENGIPLTVFKPPLQLYVIYKDEDLKHAEGEKKLGLGFWDIEQKNWIVKTQEKDELELHKKDSPNFEWPFDEFIEFPKDALGYGVVEISNWGDRPVAWGRVE